MKIFLYGVPGVGKTYLSRLLGKKLNLPVLEADRLKQKARKNKSKSDHPFLFLSTCKAYKHFGALNQDNAVKGLLRVRKAFRNTLLKSIEDRTNVICEGAFLDPIDLQKEGQVLLLVSLDEKQHNKQFIKHREKLLDLKGKEFIAARLIQSFLVTEAHQNSIPIIENNSDSLQQSIENLY